MKRGFKSRAEEQAIHWRKQLSLQPWDRLPASRMAAHLRVDVLEPSRIGGLDDDRLGVLLKTRTEEWSAVSLVTDEGTHAVIENPTHTSKRREATLMHELSHIILQHRPTAFDPIHGLGIAIRSFDKEQEDEADWFGRCLQIPKPVLGYCLNREFSIEQISEYCHASESVVRFRLNMSGVLAMRRRMGMEVDCIRKATSY